MMSSDSRKLLFRYGVLVVSSILLSVIVTMGKAHAISDIFPDPGSMGGDANAVVARVGGSYRLDATSVAFKIFIPVSYSGNVRVAIHDACNNYVYGDYRTEFGLYTTPGGEEPISGPTQRFVTDNCSNTSTSSPGFVCSSYPENRCLNINTSSLNQSTVRGHENYYTLVLKADHIGSGGGINGFQVEVIAPGSGAIVTFRDLYQRDVWNGGGLTEVNSYVEPASFNSFAVLDQAFPGNGEDSYQFTFQAACDYTATTAFIKWSDADVGASNEDGDISFRLINLSTGSPVSLRVYNGSGTVLSTGTTTVSGSLIGGEDQYRAARFNIQPNTNYRWVWSNVQDVNGVQLWMPFNEINQSQNCNTPPTLTAYPSCNAITGSYREPDGSTTIQARVSLEDGSNATTLSANVPASASARSYSIPVPDSVKSASQRTRFQWVRIADAGGAGYIYANGFATDPLITCGTGYNNTPLSQAASGYPTAGSRVYPGDLVRVNTRVRNTGNGNSPLVDLRVNNLDPTLLEQVGTGAPWDSNDDISGDNFYRFDDEPGPTAGNATIWYTTTYRVRDVSTTENDTEVCIQGVVSPAQGQTTPPPVTTTVASRAGNEVCFEIYNLQYDLTDPIAAGDQTGAPDADVSVTFSTDNIGNGHTPDSSTPFGDRRVRAEYSDTYLDGAAFSITDNFQLLPRTNPGSGWSSTGITVNIPPDAQIGQSYCVSLRIRPQNGYSDGSDYDLSRVTATTEHCVNVSDGPYLQVYGNDVWGGATFGSVCSPPPSGIGSIKALVSSSPSPTVGALSEYAVYSWGSIIGFDSSFTHGGNSNSLKFANTVTPPGQLGATKCVPDYFSELDISNTTSETLEAIIANNSIPSEQYFLSTDQVFNNSSSGSTNYNKRLTLLVDGNVEILRNIMFKGSYTSNADIPSLIIIASGNINIGPNVDRLDGIFLSYGTINTCDNGGDPLAASGNADDCDRPLLINGALMAQKLEFRRTNGGTNESKSGPLGRCEQPAPFEVSSGAAQRDEQCAAELIRFSPEAYLADFFFRKSGGVATSNRFEIQQLIDLPPIY